MNKPTLLLLPGLVCDRRLWQHQIDGLADITHTQVADLSGADTIAELATAVLAQAPAGQFALAGLSMGGYVALEIMRQAPERVLALALLDSSARPDTTEATENRRKMMELAETDFTAVVESLVPKLIHPEHMKDIQLKAIITAMAYILGKDIFIQQQKAIIGRQDSRPTLKNIQCPTLVLCGRDDAITPIEVHEEMRKEITNATLHVVDTCGHLSTLEQPHQVTAAMKEWLRGIDS